MNRRLVILLLICGALAGVAIGVKQYAHKTDQANNVLGVRNPESGRDGSSSVDLSDDRNLLGIAHYLFIGKVISQGEPKKLSIFTLYPYTMDVLLNIKGTLQGAVTVYTHGLQPGSTYLLGARWNENDWGLITSFLDGRELLSSDETLTSEQLTSLAEKNDRVIALQKAYPNEISFYGDVMHPTTWNSYQSLQSGHLLTPPPFEPSPAANAPANNSATSPVPVNVSTIDAASPTPSTDTTAPITNPAAESVSPTPTPEASTMPVDTSSPAPSPSDSAVPAAS
jgi:hypothetical protein